MLRALGTPREKPRGRVALSLFLGLLAVALLIPTVAAAAGGIYYANVAASLRPRLDQLASYQERAFQQSRIFDRNGKLLYEFVNAGRRDPVKLDQVAQALKDATISVEDKTFYENVGVDYQGIARAIFQNFTSGKEVSGASTITQQLIKLVVLSNEERSNANRYRRKLQEIILAQQIGDQFTKDQILELYLNEINYGNLAYGIQAASKTYFDRNASELNLNQASLLAGLPQQPAYYDPLKWVNEDYVMAGVKLKSTWLNQQAPLPNGITPPRARQVDVLRQMVLNGKISNTEARNTIAQDLQFTKQVVPIQAPHFVFYVKEMLGKDPTIGRLLANEGGLTITTTLDLDIQNLAQQEAARRIDELEKEKRNIHNAAVVVEQPRTGQILAMVGSIDYNRSKKTTTPGETGNVLDGNVNVTTRERQPGSALKPFTYLSALEQGKLDPGSILWDVETKFPIKAGATRKNLKDPEYWYGPKDFDQKWRGPIRMRESLANSLNMPAVKTLKRAGVSETIDLLHRAGITGLNQPPDYYGLALTLGGGAVTPLDLTTAYNTLANDGEYVPATPILKITDRSGKPLEFNPGERRQAIDPKYVAIVRDFMGDNEARTPLFGRNNPLNLSRPARAKTGTTEDFRDAWALGYTPYVTVGVWTGNNNNEKTEKVESVTGGGVIWNRIMEALFKDPKFDRFLRGPDLSVPLDFPSPARFGLEQRRICQLGGRFGQRSTEWFVPSENGARTSECDLFRTITVVADANGGYCLPLKGVNYGDRLVTLRVGGAPPSTDDEVVVDPAWENGMGRGSSLGVEPTDYCSANVANAPLNQPTTGPVRARPTSATNPGVSQPTPAQQIPRPRQPTPRPAPSTAPAPPAAPVARIPSLVGLGENQAKGVLAGLGITSVVIDYQGKDRLGALYDKFPAYAVVSHSPGPGTPATPGMTVVLGIRAP